MAIRERGMARLLLLSVPLCLLVMVSLTEAGRLPPAPRKLRVRVISPHTVKLKWRDPGRNRGRNSRFYSVRYSKVGEESSSKFVQTQETRTRVTKLHPNTTYVFAVKSVAGKRGSPWSQIVTATTGVVQNSIVTKLRATPLTSHSIRLSWKLPKVTNETVAYAILWSEVDMDKSDERTAVVANGSTSFTFENLRPHRVYGFRLRTMLSEGPGGSTEKVRSRPFTDKPNKAPRNVSLQYSNSSYVLVSWRPPPMRQRNGPLLGYKIQYKRKGSRRGDLCTVITKPEEKQYVLTDIADGETYKVRVAATTVNGTGPYSKWEAVDIPRNSNSDVVDRKYRKRNHDDTEPDGGFGAPARPEKVTAIDIRSTAVTLTWSQPDPPECCPIVAYRIITRNLNMSALTGDMVIGPTPIAKISFLLPDNDYGFNVSAYSIAGESEPSEELIVQTLPAEPPSIVNVYGSSVVVGSSANLTCVVSAEPPPEVQWYGPNRTLAYSSSRITNMLLHREKGVNVVSLHNSARDVTSHLLMDTVTLEQAGMYTCEAKNSAGASRMNVSLQVNVAPQIIRAGGAEVMDGMPAQLICSVTGRPMPTVVWLREDAGTVYEEESTGANLQNATTPYVRVVAENSTLRTAYLHFPCTSLSHVANYTCLARSVAGSTETRIMLRVKIPLPPPVQNVRALALSPNSVSVLWDDPFDYSYTIDGYRVSYREESTGNLVYLETPDRKLNVYGLRPNSTYSVNIRGYNSNRLGPPCKDVIVSTLSNDGLEPANVSAVALNASIIQLDWASPKSIDRMYILGYNIYYRRENETRVEMLFIEGNRNKQFLIGLGRDDTYYLRIATLTTWGYEAQSQWIRIQKHPQELLPPIAPQKVTAITMIDSIRVSWTSSLERDSKKSPLLGYRLVYGPVDDPSEINRMDLLATATQFTIRGLQPSTRYIIAIRAFNQYAMSDPVYLRAETKVIPPTTVVNATAVPLSPTEIHVHWKAPERGIVTKYQIRYWRPGKRDKQSAWLKAPTTDYIAGSLKKFSNYRFEIIPFSDDVIGEGSVIFAETFSGRPDAPPSKVVMKALNATHIFVSWEEPEEESQNGPITGYKLIMKKESGPRLAKFSVETNRRNYTFKNLEPGGTYKLRMAAMTVNGTGPFTDWIVSSTEKIEMRQPEKPESLHVETTAYTITVRWKPPFDIGVPVMGYIVGHGRYIPEVYRAILGPGQREHIITGLKPETEHIVSVRAFNHIGESHPQFTVVMTDKAPEKPKLEVPVKLTVRPLSPTTMEVAWVDPVVARMPDGNVSDGRRYLMRYSAISGEAYQYLNATTTAINVTNLQAATIYEFAVRTTRGDEQSGWSLPVVNTTQQTAPASPPGSVTVHSPSDSHTSFFLNWTEPDSPNGKIEEYFVYFTADPGLDTKLWITKTTKKRSMVISDVIPHTSYYFKVQARNTVGYGPLSRTVVYSPPTDSRAAPTNVTVLSSYGNLSTAVEVLWLRPERPVGQVTGYMVYHTDNVDQSDLNWIIQSERGLSSLILGLSHNTTYFVKVRARYGASLGPFSDIVSFATPTELEYSPTLPPEIDYDDNDDTGDVNGDDTDDDNDDDDEDVDDDASGAASNVPPPPSDLHLSGGNDHINATWEAPENLTSSVISYHLELSQMGQEGSPDELIDAVNTTYQSHLFWDLYENTTYTVSVAAFSESGFSLPVVEIFHTTSSTETETTE